MNDDIQMLITLTNGEEMIRIALRVTKKQITEDDMEFWAESETKKKIHDLLPFTVRNWGQIIDIERLFDITII